jgi:deoxyribodipyrimidine photo-lyase
MAIQFARIRVLNEAEPRTDARYVLYWMQQSQRARFNPALELAIEEANARALPVLVCFGLTDGYPDANARHYAFMLEGLAEVSRVLTQRGIAFALRHGAPDEVALGFAQDAALVVCDRGYLKPQKAWRTNVSRQVTCRLVQVEGDVVVPIETTSPKHEVGARTLRPKLYRLWEDYIVPLTPRPVRCPAGDLSVRSDFDLTDVPGVVRSLRSTRPSPLCAASRAEPHRPVRGWIAFWASRSRTTLRTAGRSRTTLRTAACPRQARRRT